MGRKMCGYGIVRCDVMDMMQHAQRAVYVEREREIETG